MPLEVQNPKVSPFYFAYPPPLLPFATLTGVSRCAIKEPSYGRDFQGGSREWSRVGWGKGRGGGVVLQSLGELPPTG